MKPKKCKICSNTFTPQRPIQGTCSIECAIKHARNLEAKKADKKVKEMKKGLLTHSDYIQLLQKVFNTYIRLRDKDLPCISCDCDMTNRKGDASHYIPTTYQYLRFNELNVHLSCVTCNRYKHGNIHEYRPRLIAKIGLKAVEELEASKHKKFHLSIPEIEEKIKYYRNLTKIMKKSLHN